MNGSGDWIWYSPGALLGTLVLALGAWSLKRDRARGRRRCRRCGYSMDGILVAGACLLASGVGVREALAQDMEPRRWTHLPVDLNVVGVTYIYTSGELQFDPVLRLSDVKLDMQTAMLSYSRSFDLSGTTARLDVQLPLQHGHWEGLVDGEPRAVNRDGLGDPRVRLSVLLTEAPALEGPEFQEYRKGHLVSTVVGAAVALRLPLGEYMEDKLLNLGENRLVLEPQIGVLHTNGPWSFELTGSAYLYGENDEFLIDNSLEQDPFHAVQAHVVRMLGQGWWVSAGAAYGWAGESAVNGEGKDDAKSNVLYGASFGFPVGKAQSMQVGYFRREVLAETGLDGHTFYAGWSTRF